MTQPATNVHAQRLDALRSAMSAQGVQAVIIPRTDPHLSEYIAGHWHTVRWLSGFTGSAATLVVTLREALLWTDSRYFLQASQQLAGSGVELMKDGLPDTPSIDTWLTRNLRPGDTVGVDGMTISIARAEELAATLAEAGITLELGFAPIGELWTDRPALPECPVYVHAAEYAGEDAASKIAKVMEQVKAQGADALFISALDEIAWLLNLRSDDVPYNPVLSSFLFIGPDRKVLFVDPAKLTPEVRAYLESIDMDTLPYDKPAAFLSTVPEELKVAMSATQNASLLGAVVDDQLVRIPSPVAMLKAVKNPVQIAGVEQAMRRDGAALVGAMMELEQRLADKEKVTEMDVAEILTRHRAKQPLYVEDSFDTIAGFGPHGAIVHYSADEASNATISGDSLLLIDSGANYLDGTTDITRTVAIGTPTPQMRHDFTLVMKGHIAIALARYPAGTRGHQLDAMARMPLWKEGKSYLHGTGHGVGHFLNVHEGPQSIRLNDTMAPLLPGMITSNEPGLYLTGLYGIRCENLVLTVPWKSTPEFGDFYEFRTLTLFPFDRTLFDLSIMTPEEVKWVDDYHAQVLAALEPLLTPEQAAWLRKATAPLA